jgi:hypothetical protein
MLMLHYDVWQSAAGFDSLQESINQIGKIKFSRRDCRSIRIVN